METSIGKFVGNLISLVDVINSILLSILAQNVNM